MRQRTSCRENSRQTWLKLTFLNFNSLTRSVGDLTRRVDSAQISSCKSLDRYIGRIVLMLAVR